MTLRRIIKKSNTDFTPRDAQSLFDKFVKYKQDLQLLN